MLNLTMSLRKWLVSRNGDCSGSDTKALMAAAEAVEAVQKEREELERQGRKRKSSERHQYDEATKTAIGRYAQMHGNKRAVLKLAITVL